MTNLDGGAVSEIAGLAQSASGAETLELGEYHIVAGPNGVEHIDLTGDRWRDAPRRKVGMVTVRDVVSFLGYWEKHSDQASEIFADRERLTVTAVLDAHGMDEPRWQEHRLVLGLRHSKAFQAWQALDGKPLSQTAFAEFIEDRRPDIVNPSAAELLELAMTFQAVTRVSFKSSSVLKSGQRQLSYVEETDAAAGAKGNITIPDSFELALKVFDGAAEADPVTARLRYRISNGNLSLIFVLDQLNEVVDTAFKAVWDEIDTSVEQPILRGSPA